MAGYSPASNTQSNLPQSTVISYDKNFVENLKAETPALRCTNRRELPKNSGNQLKLFMYQTLGANTNQAAEGTVGNGITLSVISNSSTIGQYADYLNVSDLAMDTAIDPTLENGQKELAYRLALSLNTLVIRTADSTVNIDSSVLQQNSPTALFARTNITTAVASLLGRNVKPFGDGKMMGLIHPFGVGDALNDPAYNGVSDILKRTAEGQERLRELPSGEEMVPVLDWSGVSFFQTTQVTTTPNYKGNTGVTALRTYIFGDNGVISVSLGATEGTKVGDGNWRNLQLWTNRYATPSTGDPSRMIGGSTAYNVKWVPTVVPDSTQRVRLIDAPTAIS